MKTSEEILDLRDEISNDLYKINKLIETLRDPDQCVSIVFHGKNNNVEYFMDKNAHLNLALQAEFTHLSSQLEILELLLK